MAKEVIRDYETVENEREIIVCDWCNLTSEDYGHKFYEVWIGTVNRNNQATMNVSDNGEFDICPRCAAIFQSNVYVPPPVDDEEEEESTDQTRTRAVSDYINRKNARRLGHRAQKWGFLFMVLPGALLYYLLKWLYEGNDFPEWWIMVIWMITFGWLALLLLLMDYLPEILAAV